MEWKRRKRTTIAEYIMDWLLSKQDGSQIYSHDIQQDCTTYVRTMKNGNVLPSTVERAWRKLRNENFTSLRNRGIELKANGMHLKYGEHSWTLMLNM